MFLMIYAIFRESSGRGKPSTCLPRMDHGAKEENITTGTLRCRFREKIANMTKLLGGKTHTQNTSIDLRLCMNSMRAVNRQPGYRPGDS